MEAINVGLHKITKVCISGSFCIILIPLAPKFCTAFPKLPQPILQHADMLQSWNTQISKVQYMCNLTLLSWFWCVLFNFLWFCPISHGIFFNCYLIASRPALGHSQGESLTNSIVITAFELLWPKGHQEPCNEVGSLSLAKWLVGFEPVTFWFLSHHLNSLGHSHQNMADWSEPVL